MGAPGHRGGGDMRGGWASSCSGKQGRGELPEQSSPSCSWKALNAERTGRSQETGLGLACCSPGPFPSSVSERAPNFLFWDATCLLVRYQVLGLADPGDSEPPGLGIPGRLGFRICESWWARGVAGLAPTSGAQQRPGGWTDGQPNAPVREAQGPEPTYSLPWVGCDPRASGMSSAQAGAPWPAPWLLWALCLSEHSWNPAATWDAVEWKALQVLQGSSPDAGNADPG